MHKVWIEVALNGAWNRWLQPRLPDTVETTGCIRELLRYGPICKSSSSPCYAQGGNRDVCTP
jgi:hypothetical protein